MSKTGLHIIGLLLCTTSGLWAERPFIWVRSNERTAILEKIEQQPWAKQIFTDFMAQLDLAIEDHPLDPEEFLLGLTISFTLQN